MPSPPCSLPRGIHQTGAAQVVDRAHSSFHAGLQPPAVQVRGSESVVQLGAPAGVPEGPPVRGISRSLGHLRPHVLQVMSNSVVHMDVVVFRGLFRGSMVDTGVGFGQEADRQAQAISWELAAVGCHSVSAPYV